MPICPTCGNFVEDGVETCSCGTKFIVSDEEKLRRKFREEEMMVEKYRSYEIISKEAFENKDYKKSLEYAQMAIDLDLGADAIMKYTKGKSLFMLDRFYDCIKCFEEYIDEYKNSFYRFSNISGAYHWKARAQWQLGDGFGSIKSYYKAIDFVDKKNGSNDYKNEIRFQIMEEKQDVINSSKGTGITNPRLGNIDYETQEAIEKFGSELNFTMQTLYDAISKVESEGYEYKSIALKDDMICVSFENDDSTIEKFFVGSKILKD